MSTNLNDLLRGQLLDRRQKLQGVLAAPREPALLKHLLEEVDAALARMDLGTYGLCEACQESIESDRLIADPLLRFCLDHLTPSQQRALQEDLELAWQIQSGLLPKKDLLSHGWQVAYHYEPAGPVSGDYCDLITSEDGGLYFMLGDVSGKGIAASMLMAHLHAMFRTLISLALPLSQMVARASRLFCESTLPTHYATLVCGRAGEDGEIEICNAGHIPPLLLAGQEVMSVEATGLPVGLFCNQEFTIERMHVSQGSTLLLFTDGIPEARNDSLGEFGIARVLRWVREHPALPPATLIEGFVGDLAAFRSQGSGRDDVSIMAIQRLG